MEPQLADEIIQCLPRERTLFRYYKGRFANLLLAMVSQRYKTVSALKTSPFERLTKRPEVAAVLANQGNGKMCPAAFERAWQEPSHCFRLTVGLWKGRPGSWGQVSRRGTNLVLQLNFSNEHNDPYRRLYKPNEDNALNFYLHPVANGKYGKSKEETLAWSRIDLDFSSNEALIEEIQSDWVRKAANEHKEIERCERLGVQARTYGSTAAQRDRLKYLAEVLPPYLALWQEVMLAATIWFIREELGVGQVFIHTPEGGAAVKRIRGTPPPRSIYSSLPKKFCFEISEQAPEFLSETTQYKRLVRRKPVKWQHLSL